MLFLAGYCLVRIEHTRRFENNSSKCVDTNVILMQSANLRRFFVGGGFLCVIVQFYMGSKKGTLTFSQGITNIRTYI